MKGKKEAKNKVEKASSSTDENVEVFGEIKSGSDLKVFLLNIRDKMTEEQASPIYAMTAMNYVMNLPDIYSLMDNENKEIARDIWLRIKQAGLQIKNPAMLFGAEESEIASSGS